MQAQCPFAVWVNYSGKMPSSELSCQGALEGLGFGFHRPFPLFCFLFSKGEVRIWGYLTTSRADAFLLFWAVLLGLSAGENLSLWLI
jgi:hypothetical protein